MLAIIVPHSSLQKIHLAPSSRSETLSCSRKDASFESSISSPSRSDQPLDHDIKKALDDGHQEIHTKSQINAVASENLTSEVGPFHGNDENDYDIYQKGNDASGTKCMSTSLITVFGGR